MNLTEQGVEKIRKVMPQYVAEAEAIASNVAIVLLDAWRDQALTPETKQFSDAFLASIAQLVAAEPDDRDDAMPAVWSAVSAIEERAFLVGFQLASQLTHAGGSRSPRGSLALHKGGRP